MENFYRRFSIAFLVLGHPVALWFGLTGHPLIAFGILSAANLGVWIPTVIANKQWFGRTVTSFETSRDEVWLTFDDGPDGEDTDGILEILEGTEAKATFFVVGSRVDRFPEEVRAIREAGHQLGNHTQHHLSGSFWALPSWMLRSEVGECGDSIEGVSGEQVEIFRPPVGMKNPLLQPILDRAGLTHIGWSARGFDGLVRDAEFVLRWIRPRLRPGAIIMIHQGRRDREGRLLAPQVLKGLHSDLEERGLKCVIPSPESYLPKNFNQSMR